jgi:hypothetical protein
MDIIGPLCQALGNPANG